jgi:hypothetical protein
MGDYNGRLHPQDETNISRALSQRSQVKRISWSRDFSEGWEVTQVPSAFWKLKQADEMDKGIDLHEVRDLDQAGHLANLYQCKASNWYTAIDQVFDRIGQIFLGGVAFKNISFHQSHSAKRSWADQLPTASFILQITCFGCLLPQEEAW